MGGLTWSLEEEAMFWRNIVPMSPHAARKPDTVCSWIRCAAIMRKRMGKAGRRRYNKVNLYEHFYQNVHERTSPQARKFVKEYLEQCRGGTASQCDMSDQLAKLDSSRGESLHATPSPAAKSHNSPVEQVSHSPAGDQGTQLTGSPPRLSPPAGHAQFVLSYQESSEIRDQFGSANPARHTLPRSRPEVVFPAEVPREPPHLTSAGGQSLAWPWSHAGNQYGPTQHPHIGFPGSRMEMTHPADITKEVFRPSPVAAHDNYSRSWPGRETLDRPMAPRQMYYHYNRSFSAASGPKTILPRIGRDGRVLPSESVDPGRMYTPFQSAYQSDSMSVTGGMASSDEGSLYSSCFSRPASVSSTTSLTESRYSDAGLGKNT